MSRLSRLSLQYLLTTTFTAAILLSSAAAHAQATLSFSGGNGTPITLTLAAPVTYTITSNLSSVPIFVFSGVRNPFSILGASGTLTFTKNGGTPVTLNTIGSQFNGTDLKASDTYVFNESYSSAFVAGDQLTLLAGSLTTRTDVPGVAPAGGTFTTFVINGNSQGDRISSNGVAATAAPEPGTIALLLTAGVPVAGLVRRRKKVSTTA